MNKSKIAASTALATIMSATAAHADLSLSGAIAGVVNSGDATTGVNHAITTSSVYVSYSSTLDNGMGLNAGFSITSGSNRYTIAVDTGMGSINFGENHRSHIDGIDGMKAGVNAITTTAGLGTYNDGDTAEGMGVRYTSPSISGWTFGASVGDNVCTPTTSTNYTVNTASQKSFEPVRITTSSSDGCNDERVSTMGINGSVAGVAVAFGQANQTGSNGDDTFVTLGYSVAGVSLGYGNYDSDGDGDSTVMGLNTSMAGLSLGVEVEEWDSGSAAADQDQTSFSVGKDLGGMGVTLIYADTDNGTGVDNQNWTLYYSVGF